MSLWREKSVGEKDLRRARIWAHLPTGRHISPDPLVDSGKADFGSPGCWGGGREEDRKAQAWESVRIELKSWPC